MADQMKCNGPARSRGAAAGGGTA